jgi:transposase
VKVWQALAEFIIDDRKTAEDTARGLNGLNLLTRDGKQWTGANVIQRVNSTVLDGYVMYRNPERAGKGSSRRDDSGELLYGDTVMIPVPAPLPPERVADLRKCLHRRSFRKSTEREYLLSTRLFGVCGSYYVGTHRGGRDRTTYRCQGKSNGLGNCSCQEILAADMEAAVWGEIKKLLVDRLTLRALAEEWLGTIPAQVDIYKRRIVELEVAVAEKRRLREKIREKLLLLEIEGDTDGDADLLEGMKEKFASDESALRDQIDEATSWLTDALAQKERVDSVMDVVDAMEPELGKLTFDQQLDLLELLDIRVEVTSEVPGQVRAAGCPFEEWLAEEKRMVPSPLSDEQWEKIRHLFPEPKKRGRTADPRQVFEGSLYKLREGVSWRHIPEGAFPKWHTVYQRALTWFNDGCWKAAVEALGDYAGTPVPPLYRLPDFKLTASFDPRLDMQADQVGLTACEGASQQASRILLAWVTTSIESELAA